MSLVKSPCWDEDCGMVQCVWHGITKMSGWSRRVG